MIQKDTVGERDQPGRLPRNGAAGRSSEVTRDAVVLGGNVPMDVLVKTIDRYIAGARG